MNSMDAEELSAQEVQRIVDKLKRRHEFFKTLASTIYALLIVAAISVLISTLYLPVLRVHGKSMEPILDNGDILIARRVNTFQTGDIVAFYYHNKVLLKRVIGTPGDLIDMDEEGNVYINNEPLIEPYISDKSKGFCDTELPYQVPANRIYVLGDHRSTSVDSRSLEIGTIAEEQVVGKVGLRIWPLNKIEIFR